MSQQRAVQGEMQLEPLVFLSSLPLCCNAPSLLHLILSGGQGEPSAPLLQPPRWVHLPPSSTCFVIRSVGGDVCIDGSLLALSPKKTKAPRAVRNLCLETAPPFPELRVNWRGLQAPALLVILTTPDIIIVWKAFEGQSLLRLQAMDEHKGCPQEPFIPGFIRSSSSAHVVGKALPAVLHVHQTCHLQLLVHAARSQLMP